LRNIAAEAPDSRAERIAPDIAESIMSIANLSGGASTSGAVCSINSIAFRNR
jgi:hypothetical protein